MGLQRTVQLFLMDGTPSGRIKSSLDNWIGRVYLIPRTAIRDSSEDRPELTQTGIYLLLGTSAETEEQLLYVGQARERKNGNGVLGRIAEHMKGDKHGYFTHTICIIASDNSLGPTDISYLENAFCQQAIAAGRVKVTNGNEPSPGNVTEEQQAALDEFLASAKILIGALGYRVFEAADEAKQSSLAQAEQGIKPEPLLHLEASGASGEGRQTSDGFVVHAGAQLRMEVAPPMPESARKNRERFADRIDHKGKLLRDTLFSSPSGASSFLAGSSTSGKAYRKNAAGISLGELEQAEADAASVMPHDG